MEMSRRATLPLPFVYVGMSEISFRSVHERKPLQNDQKRQHTTFR